MPNWDAYNVKTQDLPPHKLVIEALSFVEARGEALDFGCGAMRDIEAIAKKGFRHIDAVDSNPSVQEIANEKIRIGIPLTFHATVYDKFDFKRNQYDFVSAQYALPFNPPETFDYMFGRLVKSVNAGGIFTGQFFGNEDTWASNLEMTFHSDTQIRKLLVDFDILVLREEKKTKETALGGEKFWHVFHVIARKQ